MDGTDKQCRSISMDGWMDLVDGFVQYYCPSSRNVLRNSLHDYDYGYDNWPAVWQLIE